MLSGNVPNHELNEYQIVQKYAEAGRPSYTLPAETRLNLIELVENLLAIDTKVRPDSPTALQYIDRIMEIYGTGQEDEEMLEME